MPLAKVASVALVEQVVQTVQFGLLKAGLVKAKAMAPDSLGEDRRRCQQWP